MKTIDMHCDTLMAAFIRERENGQIYQCPELSLDLKRLAEAKSMAQFCAIFMLREKDYLQMKIPAATYEEYIAGCVRIFEQSIAAHSDIVAKATNGKEILANSAKGLVSGVLTMEDGVAVDGKMENLDRFYQLGIRALTLTWNYENCFGYPNSTDPQKMKLGLTSFGKDAVSHMQELGMLVDVSHLSDGGFWDVIDLAEKPIVATHSNARTICEHPRNLTDEMIRALGKNGGVMGINFCPDFLDPNPNPVSSVDCMVQMALHESNIGGIDVVAIGTDFDGIGGNLELKEPKDLDILASELLKVGFTSSEVDKIFWGNALRVIKEAMK